ncbi:phage terminase small subunit [Clostridium sp. WILCCON 0269]|uniref:Phage terminase small subunit n=1 Tax=Candidatus Clostridium eludens TaxID=3381663 RepID=A0ABW8SNC3_9CLOT
MPRQRSPNRDKAKQMYLKSKGTAKLKDIATALNVSDSQIRKWKNQDKWEETLKVTLPNKDELNSNVTKRKKGGQPENKNSKGHVSSVPKWNKNAESHGFFSKIFPPETMEVVQDIMIKDPLDMLWENIIIQYTAIARSQRIMDVKSKEEMIKELKKSKVKTKDRSTEKTSTNESEKEFEYEFQFAWDRQATFLKAQSRAMGELRSLIKQYDEMVHSNWATVTEEQKLRVEKLRVEVEKIKGNKETSSNTVQIVDDIND